jgi:hypothetical protein
MGTSILEGGIKRGSVRAFTEQRTLKPWARYLPIVNIACNAPEDADHTSTLQAQKVQETTGKARKRTGKNKANDTTQPKKNARRHALMDSESSDDSFRV